MPSPDFQNSRDPGLGERTPRNQDRRWPRSF